MVNFFVAIGPQLSKKIGDFKYVDRISRNCETFVFFPTDIDEMATVIKNLKNKHSSGHDGLSNMMVKLCVPVIMKLMVVCFNEMFIEETFPDICKIAKVIVLFKSGSDIDFNNYRTISKVFEKLIHRRMIKFLQKFKIICPEQFGFRPQHSCVHAITRITEYMRIVLEQKDYGMTLFLDFKKAFDTVDHDILIINLENYGFRGKFVTKLFN